MGGWALSVLCPCRGLGPLDRTCDANPNDVHDNSSKLCLGIQNTLYSINIHTLSVYPILCRYVYVRVHACVHMCLWSACLMMWLMVATLSLTMWWRPSGVRGPSCWTCKSTTGIHHAYTSYNARGGVYTWTRSFHPGPCYCPWLIHLSGGSPAWPKFNACKQVTQRPLVGWVDTFHRRLG